MSEAVMTSINSKWVELILSGKKTVEVRKTRPSIETPFKDYIYCTKKGEMLLVNTDNAAKCYQANGKVIGEFTCDEIYRYARFGVVGVVRKSLQYFQEVPLTYTVKEIDYKALQLTSLELERYGDGKVLYGLHISGLQVYDVPKELSDFGVDRPPQSWCYVEEI